MKPMISIIIPVYNSEKYIERCILSIINQEYNNIEILLIDDGSTDNSKSIIKKYEAIDNRIKYIYKKNGGPSSARNLGILNSSAEYIMFIDSDDYLCSNAISKLVKYLKNHDLLIFNYISNKNDIILKTDFFDFVVSNKIWAPWGKIVRKDCIKTLFNENSSIGEDLKFWYDNKDEINNYIFLDFKLYYYEINDSSLMHSKKINIKILTFFNDLYEIIIKSDGCSYYEILLLHFFNSFIENKKIDKINLLNNSELKQKYKTVFLKILKSRNIKFKIKIKIIIKNILFGGHI